VPVALIKAPGHVIQRAVDRVHDWSGDAIGHRHRGETRVIVDDVKWPAVLAGTIDLLPRAGNMV